MRKNKSRSKIKFAYVVKCNREPIVYGVYLNKQDAVRYAVNLIRWRKKRAKSLGNDFKYYHFHPHVYRWYTIKNVTGTDRVYERVTVFTACLHVPQEKNVEYGDDACFVQVERFPISGKH
jgi:hypothetical protein